MNKTKREQKPHIDERRINAKGAGIKCRRMDIQDPHKMRPRCTINEKNAHALAYIKKSSNFGTPLPFGWVPSEIPFAFPWTYASPAFLFTAALCASDCRNAYVVRSWYVLSRGPVLPKGYGKTRRQGAGTPKSSIPSSSAFLQSRSSTPFMNKKMLKNLRM